MPCEKKSNGSNADSQTIPSRDMEPLAPNVAPTFFKNQFRTTIDLPTKEMYPNVKIANVKGSCAVITGSNTGLGFETAKQLLGLGLSHLVMGVRSLEKGNAAADTLRTVAPSAKIEVWHLDMESYDSIQAFARKCQTDLPRIDTVILNAGLSPLSFDLVSATGHEKTIQANHISTALLTTLLIPVLKSKPASQGPPKLTLVNSLTAHLCKFPNKDKRPLLASFDDTNITPWDPQDRYGVSKLLNQLFLVKLTEHVKSDDVIINMVDPGLTKGTGLARDATGAMGVAVKGFLAVAGRPLDRGAATYVNAAFGQGKESHGCFLMNCKISPLAKWFYSDGDVLTEQVWNETLKELSFAGVEYIIASP
ncbi:short-chain dehydrogenase reductase family [Fusarium albosuccineum]|uniref:Short-chain dehydrogenase reductase family n=1 Tax=Fusarium albosuccineum TaxID=1237068 RepID=A0A8H4PBH0_9HYPO|nr:short-chain dehydrogenase reductase family [Fusarium albosuccineum]